MTTKTSRLFETSQEIDHHIESILSALGRGQSSPDLRQAIIFALGNVAPLPLRYNASIQIEPSPIHGSGLFARENIPAGVALTFYPAHAFALDKDVTFMDESPHFQENVTAIFNDYAQFIGATPLQKEYVIGNPLNVANSLLWGHIANDGVGNVFQNSQEKDLKKLIMAYYIQGEKTVNCMHVTSAHSLLVTLVSKRAIQKGEELCVFYDHGHWLAKSKSLPSGLDHALWIHSDRELEKFILSRTM